MEGINSVRNRGFHEVSPHLDRVVIQQYPSNDRIRRIDIIGRILKAVTVVSFSAIVLNPFRIGLGLSIKACVITIAVTALAVATLLLTNIGRKCFSNIKRSVQKRRTFEKGVNAWAAQGSADESRLLASRKIIKAYNAISLNLEGLYLESLPSEFSQLKKLKHLRLDCNRLHDLPDSVTQLVGLEDLSLKHNRMPTLTDKIDQLVGLKNLNLSNNYLTALPGSIARLDVLRNLNLSDNRFRSSPGVLIQLDYLTNIDLSNNPLQVEPNIIGQPVGYPISQSYIEEGECQSQTSLERAIALYSSLGPVAPVPAPPRGAGYNSIWNSRGPVSYANEVVFDQKIKSAENPSFSINDKEYRTSLHVFFGITTVVAASVDHQVADIGNRALQARIEALFTGYPAPVKENALNVLGKLRICRDALSDDSFMPSMRKRIKAVLDYIDGIEDEDLKQQAMGDFSDAGDACPDRAVTVLEKLDLESKLGTSTDIGSIIKFFVDRFKLDILEKIVLENDSRSENVETYLYYLIKLKDLFGLNVDVNRMLYHDIARPMKFNDLLDDLLPRISADTFFTLLKENYQIKGKLEDQLIAQLSAAYETPNSEISRFLALQPNAEEYEDFKEENKNQFLLDQLLDMGLLCQ